MQAIYYFTHFTLSTFSFFDNHPYFCCNLIRQLTDITIAIYPILVTNLPFTVFAAPFTDDIVVHIKKFGFTSFSMVSDIKNLKKSYCFFFVYLTDKMIFVMIRNKSLVLIFFMLFLFCNFVFSNKAFTSNHLKEHVILLHGLGRSSKSMSRIESVLQKNGYIVKNVNYPSKKYSIEILVEKHIAPAIKSCKDAKKIHFVTHSLGGILTRYYLEHHFLENLGKVIMLSPPNQGSEIVDKFGNFFLCKWFLGPAFQQLSTSSNSVPNMLKKPRFNLGIITGSKSFNPLFSCIIPGKDDGKVSVESAYIQGASFKTVPVTHTFIMKNNTVIENILYFLKHSSFIENN